MKNINTSVNVKVRYRGFSMIEVLVALVVLSIGLLGMAALFVTSLRSGSGAIARMQAVSLATDLADRIRANDRKQINNYTAAAANNDCFTQSCSSADMAALDLYIWNDQISNLLPPGATKTVTVTPATYTSGTPTTVNITINWVEPGATNTTSSYSLVIQI